MLKRALIAYVSNSVKAIWSVVAHPLTIVGSKNGNVKDYKIYGNSVQNGEPTPDNPVEVQSVGEYDEESGKYKVPIAVKGEKNTETVNIYLDEPLRRISNSEIGLTFADYIDYEKQQVVRNIYREVITEVESKSSNGNVFLTVASKKPYLTPVKIGGGTTYVGYALSNKFIQHIDTYSNLRNYDGYIMSYITTGGNNRVAYTFKDTSINTVEEAQMAIGDGFEVCYVLATPEVESIELPTFPQFKGTTVYEAQTEIPPSGIQVQYY